MSKNIQKIPTAEFDAVIAAANKYVDGLRIGSVTVVSQAFHKDATMYGFTVSGQFLGGHIKSLYDFVEHHGAAPDIVTRSDILDITPTTAIVRINMEKDAAGQSYTDFHTLLKQNGEWKIIAKVFHNYES
ncbi:hypothetical protein DL95DRAFT_398183 [Leptodontidium sp. 2 PMI_412]|nr:hypothetical protein DL95DRAFT_398183 [Leptodontidium sp. 2 PMI_412]